MNLRPSPVAFILFLLAGWISRQQLIVVEYLKAENRMLRARLNGRSLRFTYKERALLARKAFGIPRKVLLDLGTIVTPDTLLRWHGNWSLANSTSATGASLDARKRCASLPNLSCAWR